MVSWKEIPKIDAHIHLLPDDVICANSGCGDTFVDYGATNDYLNIMKVYNIECAFIMPFNDTYMMSMDFAIETVHSNLQKMSSSAPTKLFCFADVDIRKDIMQTIAELEKVLRQSEFIGIKLHPTNVGYPIDRE
jgi:predicted TIM-barrel fold metal-dependent hydrolase